MAATLIRLVPVHREEAYSDYSSHTGNVGVIDFRSVDPSVTFNWRILITEDAITASHFAALAKGDLLLDKSSATLYIKDAAADTDGLASVDVTT
jgi:hypothetical protein